MSTGWSTRASPRSDPVPVDTPGWQARLDGQCGDLHCRLGGEFGRFCNNDTTGSQHEGEFLEQSYQRKVPSYNQTNDTRWPPADKALLIRTKMLKDVPYICQVSAAA
jgi:hypothetical protein